MLCVHAAQLSLGGGGGGGGCMAGRLVYSQIFIECLFIHIGLLQ